MDAGIPIDGLPEGVEPTGNIQYGDTYAGRVLVSIHVGPYHELGQSYDKFNAYIKLHGFEVGAPPWESYVDDPGEVAEENLRTIIYFPIQ